MIEIPVDLKNAIKNNQLIVFVGAGLSCDLKNINGQKLGGWKNLVEQILLDLKEKGHKVELLLPLLDIYDPLTILNLIEKDNDLRSLDIHAFLKNFLDIDCEGNNFGVHELISQLSGKIITTNYDNAFEVFDSSYRKNKAFKGTNSNLATHTNAESKLLFKLHGCFEFPDSMVLFPKD